MIVPVQVASLATKIAESVDIVPPSIDRDGIGLMNKASQSAVTALLCRRTLTQ